MFIGFEWETPLDAGHSASKCKNKKYFLKILIYCAKYFEIKLFIRPNWHYSNMVYSIRALHIVFDGKLMQPVVFGKENKKT